MSLVEKALKKLQDSRGSESAPSAPMYSQIPEVAQATYVEEVRSSRVISLDRVALRAGGLMPPLDQERSISEQFRQIKRPLVAAALKQGSEGKNLHVIMVSSSRPGEGKTFVSVNLALSLSLERDIKVVLVDADVAKRDITVQFGLGDEPGLLDALQDQTLNIENLILPTDVPNLSVLPAGRWTETATELLASRKMAELMSALARKHPNRMALFDSAPLLLTNESRVLAQSAGQLAVVVRAGVTSQQDLLDALAHIPEDKTVGLVLNQSMSASESYYYQGVYTGSTGTSKATVDEQVGG